MKFWGLIHLEGTSLFRQLHCIPCGGRSSPGQLQASVQEKAAVCVIIPTVTGWEFAEFIDLAYFKCCLYQMKIEGLVNKRQGRETETIKSFYSSEFVDTASFDKTVISENYSTQVKRNYLWW